MKLFICSVILFSTICIPLLQAEDVKLTKLEDYKFTNSGVTNREKFEYDVYNFFEQGNNYEDLGKVRAKFNKKWLEDEKIILNDKQVYFLPPVTFCNTAEIPEGEQIDIYTRFNVVYYLEKEQSFITKFTDDLPEWWRVASSGTVSALALTLSFSQKASYDDANTSAEATSSKKSSKTWGVVSGASIIWLGYEIYHYFQ